MYFGKIVVVLVPMRDWVRLGGVAIVLAVLLASCSGEPDKKEVEGKKETPPVSVMPPDPEFSPILPEDAFDLLDTNKNVLLVDVRTSAERERSRIPNSVELPLNKLMSGEVELPRDKPLLMICAVGGRSYAAGLYLMSKDYLQVYNLKGGIIAWEKAGLPMEYGQQ